MKILVVEDNEQDIQSFKRSVNMFNLSQEAELQCIYSSSIADADEKMDSSIDVAIVDLKLAEKGDEGNTVIQHIKENWRILTYVFTGTPDNITDQHGILKVFTKGVHKHNDIFQELLLTSRSGVVEILSKAGDLEKLIDEIFWKNIVPTLNSWTNYSNDAEYSKNSLFRHALSHLSEMLEDHGSFYPEEMYICPPHDQTLKTGDLVTSTDRKVIYIVLAPACDLVIREDGNMKTESIQLCKVDVEGIVVSKEKALKKLQDKMAECIETCKDHDGCPTCKNAKEKIEKNKLALSKLKSNNFLANLHFLPKTEYFNGGEINFRKIVSVKPKDFEKDFIRLEVRVTKIFLKDIVSRFSSYYARQGQPDFHLNLL